MNKQDKRIMKNSEKVLMKTLEDMQTKLDELNGAIINARAFFYHYKHAIERYESETQ